MSSKKIVFMGTPEIAGIYLQSLIDAKHNIIGVYSQPAKKKGRGMSVQDSPVHKIALLNNINIFTPIDLNSDLGKKNFQDLQPDLIIVMGYGLKLPEYLLNLPDLGCINVHLSLLPRWRGAAPIEHVLLNGDLQTGITIFKLVEKMDAGPIIVKKTILIDESINKGALINKLNSQGTKLLNSILPFIFDKKITYKKQDESKVTYAHKISTEMRKLSFNENVESIHNKIRAFSPNPCAWFFYNNERFKIIKSNFVKGHWKTSYILNNQFHIGCNDGKICPEIIQREGKKPLHLDDFLKGFDFIVDTKVNA